MLDLPNHMERAPVSVDGILGQTEHLTLAQTATGAHRPSLGTAPEVPLE
ncbi:hypothetical protein [Streptomyces bottropensis]